MRCEATGIPASARSFATKQELGVRMLLRAKDNAALQSRWVTADDLYGESPWLRHEVTQAGFLYVFEVPRITPAWPIEVAWQTKEWSGKDRPSKARPDTRVRKTCEEWAAGLKASDWQEMVAPGAQGPHRYLFARERVRESIDGEPQEEVWLLWRRNLDGSEARYYFSNTPLDTPIEFMAKVACLWWSIETEFEETKGHVGLDEYEVRGWSGWHQHITLCFLANAILLTLQQVGEKNQSTRPLPITRPQVYRLVRAALQPVRWSAQELTTWLHRTQAANERARISHQKRREKERQSAFTDMQHETSF